MPDSATETVLVASVGVRRNTHIYHTGVCQAVRKMGRNKLRERDAERLSDAWRECRYCTGEHDRGKTDQRSHECPLCDETVPVLPKHLAEDHGPGDV
jgi:hypothetical protein